ncbi:Crp/Fnr family transcriptional regulator [Thermohalobacter berrensis]|uniref:cAMP-binding protein n=1 Tax=Thermohalobacter berrensis TaxID=99594 RepID=A0A419SU35_9FIRM|nr:Crp/Fnr family transcriptional regulator [Thermohalobacter berrensis]RKD28797.1 cAMP-binding protein [Thermohalobacter berrensis]
MPNIEKILSKSSLFKGLDEKSISDIIEKINYKVNKFSKNQTIAIEGDDCKSIGIVLKGSIHIQKIYPSGKTVTINRISKGGIFGEVIIFSNMNEYPATIVAVENTEIMFIYKHEILKLCSTNTHILNNFMELLSNKILMLNRKLKSLSYHTIREKISSFLLEEYSKQKSQTIKIKLSRKEMAERFGIPRPSLSRELAKMKKEGLIDFDRKTVKILDIDKLEDELF